MDDYYSVWNSYSVWEQALLLLWYVLWQTGLLLTLVVYLLICLRQRSWHYQKPPSPLILVLTLASSPVVFAQPLQFVECPEVNLLASACDEVVEQEDSLSHRLHAPEPPLFTLRTMRPDTPPLMMQAMNDLTDANLDAYLEWEQRYLTRTFEFEARLKQRRQQRKR